MASDTTERKRLHVLFSAEEADMLNAIANAEGTTISEVLRRLVRQEYFGRGLGGVAVVLAKAWEDFEREHRSYIAQCRQALEEGEPAPGSQAIKAQVGALMALSKQVGKHASLVGATGRYHEAIALMASSFEARDEAAFESAEEALRKGRARLWSIFMAKLDELKAAKETE